MRILVRFWKAGLALALLCAAPARLSASSHMDAPLITLDDAANTTDVYAFVSQSGGTKYLTVALGVYPFEEPGIGPNKYNFDESVLYQIHVSLGGDILTGRPTYSYQFRFVTRFKNEDTVLQSYLGVIQDVDDAAQNLTQTYRVARVNAATGQVTDLGQGTVPPNNQGNATPYYNLADNGENPAKDGVASTAALDRYTAQSIWTLNNGYRVFAGQREDGFYGDIQAIFDLLKLRPAGQAKDAQGGFNIHMIVLQIPVEELGGDLQAAGVFATTSRRQFSVLDSQNNPVNQGAFVQVGRQGNPLFNEALIAIRDKDLYSRTMPETDRALFVKYALNPELGGLINALLFGGSGPAITSDRRDLALIYIPDLIKVDLSTGPARMAGGGPDSTNPDDAGFSRLGIFGGDVLTSRITSGFGGGALPGGWPNGRRFGDDVVDIAVTAIISDLRTLPPVINGPAGDNVDKNDAVYNKVFPYAGTPLNGRTHPHHGVTN
jgi:hypothetical protein